jgi:hypothetical protein
MRRVWMGMALLGSFGLGTFLLLVGPRGWQASTRACRLPSIDSDLFFLKVPHLVRRGPDRLVVLRLGLRSRLVPHRLEPGPDGFIQPRSIEAWAAHLGAPVVVNSGQFDANLQYLGLLKSRGAWLSAQRKPAFLGLLVSGPLALRAASAGPQSKILDLAAPPYRDQPMQAIVDGYQNVVQSMMLVDEAAQVRVRKSELAACRTVIAEDRSGHLLILATEGAVTLHELAGWLSQSELQVVRAMNLDGGRESQLAIRTPELSLTLYGQYGTGAPILQPAKMVHVPLPTVIAVEIAP